MCRFQISLFFLFVSDSYEPVSNSRLLLCYIYASVLLFTLYFLFFVKVKVPFIFKEQSSKKKLQQHTKKKKPNKIKSLSDF